MEQSALFDKIDNDLEKETPETTSEIYDFLTKKRTLNEYQSEAIATAIYPIEEAVNYPILGLVGEAGELANKWKKVIRDKGGDLDASTRSDLVAELGDVLWYVAALARDLGSNLNDVAAGNLLKLSQRKAKGTLQGSGDNR